MNSYLETAISLVLIFMIFSIIVYVLQEVIAINLKYRGKMLWKSLAQLLDGYVLEKRTSLNKRLPSAGGATPITDAIYGHAQMQSLRKDLKGLPSYMPSANFALAVMDLVAKAAPVSQNDLFKDIKSGLTTFVAKGDAVEVLKNLVATSSDVKELQRKIEVWFDGYMDRVTGWYQSHTVISIRLLSIGVALFFNVNVIKLTREIYNDSQLRASLVTVAEKVADHPETVSEFYSHNFEQTARQLDSIYQPAINAATPAQKLVLQNSLDSAKAAKADAFTKKRLAAIDSMTRQLSSTRLPLGWKLGTWKDDLKTDKNGNAFLNLLLALLGWAIAAGCLSMGAPFWFDLLLKLVNVRRSGIKPTANDNKRQ